MAIQDRWKFDYDNKRLYRDTSQEPTVVDNVNDVYSLVQDTFDEFEQMDDIIAMLGVVKDQSYTMINGWFIDDESIKWLKLGAIATSGYTHPTNPMGIRLLTLDAMAGLTSDDIGKVVEGVTTGDTGKLLAYNTTRKILWVRCDAADDLFDNASEEIKVDTVTCGNMTKVSDTGEDLYANIYTLGTVEISPYAQVYIFQAGEVIPEWSNLSNWDRGHIDVLIKVKEADDEIDGAVVTIYARQSGDLYDNFEIDLTAGGRNAVPLSTADDLNEDTGEYYLLYTGETVAFTTLGQIITGGTSGATAELVAAIDWGTTGLLTLRGIKGTFQNGETITGSSEGSATVNGTVGDTYLAYKAEVNPFSVDNILLGGTSGAKRLIRGVQDDGTTGKLVLQVDTTQTGENRDPQYKAFQDNETITEEGAPTGEATADGVSTTIVSGFSDITVAFVNGTATHGGTTGTFIPGERVTWPTGQSGILLKDTGSAVTLGNCTDTALNTKIITGDISGAQCTCSQDLQSAHTMDKNFEQQSAYPYDVIINAGDIYAAGRTLAQVYEYFKFVCQEDSVFQMYTVVAAVITPLDGEEYIIAYSGYVLSKSAPLGTFAGGKYFGAQGIWVEGMASGQSYQFTDSNGAIRQPYASVPVRVTALVSGDRVAVFRTTVGAINKQMYTSHATENTETKTTFEVQEDLAVDTPASGIIRIVDMGTLVEQRHTYTSWTGKIFSGLSPALQQDYDGADKCYVPFIDTEAAAAYVEKVVLYAADRDVMIRVRKKGIIPFETAGVVGTGGLIVAAIRTTDNIVV